MKEALIIMTGGDVANADDFNPLWITEFRNTNAYAVWDRITDPLIFDIVEPRYASLLFDEHVVDIALDILAQKNPLLWQISAFVCRKVFRSSNLISSWHLPEKP